MQGYAEVKNYQRKDIVELENTSVWLTNVHVQHHFNEYIRSEKKRDILKRVILNGSTGSSWIVKRFNRLQVTVTDRNTFKNVMSG